MMPSAGSAAEAAEQALLGAVLRGKYRIFRLVDAGGAGTVFEAEHLQLHGRVAVKILRQVLADQAALVSLTRKADSIRKLEHPNVVRVLDFDTAESGAPYLVMEYLTGRSLAALLAERGQLELQDVARLVSQAAAGLAAAHRESIVHRDLRPTTIFLANAPGEREIVKLLDFGLTRRIEQDQRLTGEYDVLGVPHYVAPEQALGRSFDVGPHSDQYSLAVIAYEAIAGRPPFLGTDRAEVLERVIANEPVPLARFAPEAPRTVAAVLRQAMAGDPAERFPSVLDFAAELCRAAGYAPASASEPGFPHSHAAVSSVAVGPGVAPALRASRRPTPYEEAKTEPPPPPPRRSSLAPPDLGDLLDRAREAFGLGDVDLAANYVERALTLADQLPVEASTVLDRASVLIDTVLRSRLGAPHERLRVRVPVEGLALLPEQAFLLSRLEGSVSVDEILDLSPLSKRVTLRHLVTLLRRGVIALG